ncbi:SHC-transforming protein 1-like isoform X2 [Amphiura filiformis]|uniref:SHC-transforming protein 1-like isoform X2 n=1 Tax=Amphiura filiformis TaxID=82378 RepID=UPI003B20EDE5
MCDTGGNVVHEDRENNLDQGLTHYLLYAMAGVFNNFKKNKGPNMVGQRANEELWTRTGTFVNKPQRGWLHTEEKVKAGGICYGVRYVGCLEVKQSMRTLPFEMRGQVTKEAIFRVCDAAGFRYNRKKKAPKNIGKILADSPNIQFGAANVNLTISTASITLTIMETGKMIASHQMQGISFASGGDQETPEYVAYVAKDPVNGRACHVLECLGGLAQDVITTVGQAFEIRFKDYLRNPPQAVSTPDRFQWSNHNQMGSVLAEPIFGEEEESAWGDDPDYYNDIAKLAASRNQGEPLPPPPPGPGQYMPTSNAMPTENTGYQSLKSNQRHQYPPSAPPADNTVPAPMVYDNRANAVPVNNNRQPPVGRLIDLDDTPAAPMLDNPLSHFKRNLSQQSSKSDSDEAPALKPRNSQRKMAGSQVKRRTPSLYDNPPCNVSNKRPNDIHFYQNMNGPDWKRLVEAGYDNLRIPPRRSRSTKSSSPSSSSKVGGSQVYSEPKLPSYDDSQYDVPPTHRQPVPEPSLYNVPPTANQPLSTSPHEASAPPQASERAGHTQNGGQHNQTDAFDMEPFNPTASAPQSRTPPARPVPPRNPPPAKPPPQQPSTPESKELTEEEWFHGPMSRKEGEALLEEDGDFLVRESTTSKGQYVLSGMQNGQPKHLLLVDPSGKVRTKDKEFDNVSHLINYHRGNNLPIISAGSAVYLKFPVLNAMAAGKLYNT